MPSRYRFNFERKDTLIKWTEFVRKCKGLPDWKPSKWSSICNKHFRPQDFRVKKGLLRQHLRPDAVPTIECPVESTVVVEPPAPPKPTLPIVPQQYESSPPFEHSYSGHQCRFCTSLISNGTGFNIFQNANLFDWTSQYLRSLSILPDDFLTKFVCNACYLQLEQFNRFHETAVLSQTALNSSRAVLSRRSSENPMSTSHSRTNGETSRVMKIKQEPIVSIKEENHLLNTPLATSAVSSEPVEDFANNLSSLLSDFCHYDLNSGHILAITDLSNEFINLTEEDNEASSSRLSDEINVKPNIVSTSHNSTQEFPLKQEDGVDSLLDEFYDEDGLFKAMISNEHSYCKFNAAHLLEGTSTRLIKTEQKEEQQVAVPQPLPPPPPPTTGNVPKI